jgi:hypothetical protein
MRLGGLVAINHRYRGKPVTPKPLALPGHSRLDKRRAKPRKGRRPRNKRREGSQLIRLSEPQGEPIMYGESAEGILSRWKRAGPPNSGRSIPGGLTPVKARTVPPVEWQG